MISVYLCVTSATICIVLTVIDVVLLVSKRRRRSEDKRIGRRLTRTRDDIGIDPGIQATPPVQQRRFRSNPSAGYGVQKVSRGAPVEGGQTKSSVKTTDEHPRETSAISPVNIGGEFAAVNGHITATGANGPSMALDSGDAFSGIVEIRAASLVGDRHILQGTQRQDSYALDFSERNRKIEVAVCDGVGSRAYSHKGATMVASAIVQNSIASRSNPVEIARTKLQSLANEANVPVEEFSTTLIWMSITVGPQNHEWDVRITQYGDGDVRILGSDGLWHPVSEDPPGSESDPSTFCLPEASRPARRCRFEWNPGEVLVVASDGMSPHLYSDTKVGHYLAQEWTEIPDRWRYLSQVAFRTTGAGDDRTVVTLWRTDNSTSQLSDIPGVTTERLYR